MPEATSWLHEHALDPFLEETRKDRLTEVERVSAHVELSLTELLQRADEEIGRAASDVDQKLPGAEGRLAMAESRHAELLARRERRRTTSSASARSRCRPWSGSPACSCCRTRSARRPRCGASSPNFETEASPCAWSWSTSSAQGRQVYDVSEKNLGYDVTSLDLASGELRLIEVKGLGAATGTVLLTPNERRVAEDRRDCFWLYVVTNCSTDAPAPGADPRPGTARLDRGHEGGALLPVGERDDQAADAGARGLAALRDGFGRDKFMIPKDCKRLAEVDFPIARCRSTRRGRSRSGTDIRARFTCGGRAGRWRRAGRCC
jgi:hypothetical protein